MFNYKILHSALIHRALHCPNVTVRRIPIFAIVRATILFLGLTITTLSQAFTISFSNSDFTVAPVFSSVILFSFSIEIDEPLQTGVYSNPNLQQVNYNAFGFLVPGTPSGFSSFNLIRNISGVDFYAQGSSLNFEISATADLTDGLQASELVDTGNIFTFNGREIDNGRYHPALVELNSDGTGRLQNSNNIHTLDPLIVADFGEEYITDLSFDPSSLTLSSDIAAVPLPAALPLFLSALLFVGITKRWAVRIAP